jgi:hypothetical protein
MLGAYLGPSAAMRCSKSNSSDSRRRDVQRRVSTGQLEAVGRSASARIVHRAKSASAASPTADSAVAVSKDCFAAVRVRSSLLVD